MMGLLVMRHFVHGGFCTTLLADCVHDIVVIGLCCSFGPDLFDM